MAFTFGFAGDDIEEDNEDTAQLNETRRLEVAELSGISTMTTTAMPPRKHTLEELLSSVPSQLSYNLLSIPFVERRTAQHGAGDSADGFISSTGPVTVISRPTVASTVTVPRRAVFDINAQLMAEVDPLSHHETVESILTPALTSASASVPTPSHYHDMLIAGLQNGDLSSGIYEGGFKTWECAVDLASLLLSSYSVEGSTKTHIIELGAGSAIPSLVLLQRHLRSSRSRQQNIEAKIELRSNFGSAQPHHMHFTLCDYNVDVLRLGTAPNVFLTQVFTQGALHRQSEQQPHQQQQRYHQEEEQGDENGRLQNDDPNTTNREIEDIDPNFIIASTAALTEANASFTFISGSWGGDEFLSLVPETTRNSTTNSTTTTTTTTMTSQSDNGLAQTQPQPQTQTTQTLILASETIYSPTTTRVFARTLLDLLRRDPVNTKAWVAAKKLYFGVGGGVDDFVDLVQSQGGAHVRRLLDVNDSNTINGSSSVHGSGSGRVGGVGRVVLEITVPVPGSS